MNYSLRTPMQSLSIGKAYSKILFVNSIKQSKAGYLRAATKTQIAIRISRLFQKSLSSHIKFTVCLGHLFGKCVTIVASFCLKADAIDASIADD